MLRSILCLLLTLVGTVKSVEELFAIIGGTNCAEQLSFGNQPILPSGSADGQHPYFLSTSAVPAHTSWTQIVTSDGITELFRIYWSFSTAKTVTDRIASAVRKGEAVSTVEVGVGRVGDVRRGSAECAIAWAAGDGESERVAVGV